MSKASALKKPTLESLAAEMRRLEERVEDMGGQLSIHSAVGTGTAIEIVLPLTHQAQSLKP